METTKLHGLDLLEFGNTIQIAGIIMNSSEKSYLVFLPDEETLDAVALPLNLEEWKKFLRQTDLLEVEVLANDEGKMKKAILRKSGRQIDARVSWRVYKRDKYTCQYCGRDDVPLTVDHLVLWEEGGPSIEENLVTCCRKCNKKRGNMPYDEWLQSSRYKGVSRNLPDEIKRLNVELVNSLTTIPRRVHRIPRGSKKKK